jgi:hypothetical protein
MEDLLGLAITSSSGERLDGEMAFYGNGSVELTIISPITGFVDTYVGRCSASDHVHLRESRSGLEVDGLVGRGAVNFSLRVMNHSSQTAVLWTCRVVR